jgi:hypothetical protein
MPIVDRDKSCWENGIEKIETSQTEGARYIVTWTACASVDTQTLCSKMHRPDSMSGINYAGRTN